jgi:hypothetical protein
VFAHEGAKCLQDRLAIVRRHLIRRWHAQNAFQRIDATQAHFDLIAPKLFEALCDLIADEQVMRCLNLLLRNPHLILGHRDLLLRGVPLFEELRQGKGGADQDSNSAERLTDPLSERVLDIHAILRVADAVSELGDFALGHLPPQPPYRHQGNWQQPDSPPFLWSIHQPPPTVSRSTGSGRGAPIASFKQEF